MNDFQSKKFGAVSNLFGQASPAPNDKCNIWFVKLPKHVRSGSASACFLLESNPATAVYV